MATATRRPARLAGLAGVLLLVAGALPVAAVEPPGLTATDLTPSQRIEGFKSASADIARSDPRLLARTDPRRIDVMIKLDYDALASYAGGVAGLAPTSPRITGRPLSGRSTAERRYANHIRRQERAVVAAIRAAVPTARIGRSFRVVYGGIAASVPANRVRDIAAIDGVVAVQADDLRSLLTDSSSDFIGATRVQQALGGRPDAGAGVIYGNLDSGVWPEHPSFADQGHLAAPPAKADGTARACDFGDDPLTPASDPFACTDKLIGGKAFLATYLADPDRAAAEPYHTARDSSGHGTHTASTSAGNVLASAEVFGVERGPVNGVAPGAWLSVYKVCGIQGCFASDSASAVGQAILDGVDVINFSISGGTDPATDPVELAFLDAYAAGVFVSASAGNEGPDAATVNHLSPWVTTVGASTQARAYASSLTIDGTSGDLELEGASITAGIVDPLPVVLAADPPYSDARCQAPAGAGMFTGMIVACERGTNARVEKGYHVVQGGAAGMILYNPALADVETDNHWLPTVHLADGADFLAFLTANPGATASFTAGTAGAGQPDVMAAFSSRGPAGLVIKPDLTAPGVQILAGHTPTPESVAEGPPGESFQAIAGTSMSSPHVAGAGILLAAAHPTWTPGQIRSALMTTARTSVVKEDEATAADPFDMGAGRIDVARASAAPLTLDETATRFASLGHDPLTAVHLNIPSIDAPVMPGRITTTRVVRNTTRSKLDVVVRTSGPAGPDITVSPARLRLNPGRSATLTVTIESDASLGVQQFGQIDLLVRHGPRLHLPVAFIPTQGAVTLAQSCTPDTIALAATAACDVVATNHGFDPQVVDLRTTVDARLKILGATGGTLSGGVVTRSNVTLPGAAPGVPSVGPGALFGYLALDGFGVTPDPIGDEEIIVYDVPAFVYAGVTYTTIGVDSNGYVIAGESSSADNNCCDLPSGPSAAPPNAMLAPFWTDLDGTGAPGIFAAALTDGVDTWLVVEYRVNVWGTSDLRTFQAWIGVNGTEDITFAYPGAFANPGQPFLVGAENAAGQGDMVGLLPSEDLRVASTAPTPGGSTGYSFTVRGEAVGTGTATTTMDADGVLGTTVVESPVEVTAD